jgi:mxaJ protein
MGRGFVREYLDKSQCDLLIGIPSNYQPVLTTAPYYRSTYVFVFRRAQHLELATGFDSPDLHRLKIGVQVLDEEYSPPGEALARRGLQGHIVGFDTTGDGADSIIRAVVDHDVDVSVVWGPLASYFVQKYRGSLDLIPVEPEVDPPGLPFTFAISMGVRKGDVVLRDELERILASRESGIRGILDQYGVPQIPLGPRAADLNAVN